MSPPPAAPPSAPPDGRRGWRGMEIPGALDFCGDGDDWGRRPGGRRPPGGAAPAFRPPFLPPPPRPPRRRPVGPSHLRPGVGEVRHRPGNYHDRSSTTFQNGFLFRQFCINKTLDRDSPPGTGESRRRARALRGRGAGRRAAGPVARRSRITLLRKGSCEGFFTKWEKGANSSDRQIREGISGGLAAIFSKR